MSFWSRLLTLFRPASRPVPNPNPGGWRYASQVQPIEPFSASRLVAMHNMERMKAKLEPLLLDSHLMAKAESRAEHAAAVNLDAPHLHDGFAPNPGDVWAGENAAKGQADAAGVMADWMGSDGHRANVLNPKFTRIGCGRAVSEDGIAFWYVVFSG